MVNFYTLLIFYKTFNSIWDEISGEVKNGEKGNGKERSKACISKTR